LEDSEDGQETTNQNGSDETGSHREKESAEENGTSHAALESQGGRTRCSEAIAQADARGSSEGRQGGGAGRVQELSRLRAVYQLQRLPRLFGVRGLRFVPIVSQLFGLRELRGLPRVLGLSQPDGPSQRERRGPRVKWTKPKERPFSSLVRVIRFVNPPEALAAVKRRVNKPLKREVRPKPQKQRPVEKRRRRQAK
jgi:hypothetical protein